MPWKGEKDPYKIWLSEIILQQTRVEQGLEYYKKFIYTYPTVTKLAFAPIDDVLKLWEGLGYYSRCRNLHHTACYIAFELDGKFPSTYIELLKLKGVGAYTAAAISSFAFNEPRAVVDGNVQRVLSRYFGITTPIDSTNGKKLYADLAQSLIDVDQPASYNQAIMDFGATICKPQQPLCDSCPFIKDCQAYAHDQVRSLPVKEKKLIRKIRYFNYFIIETPSGIMVRKRESKDIWNGLNEFFLVESDAPLKDPAATISKTLSTGVKTVHQISSYRQLLTHQEIKGTFYKVNLEEAPEKDGYNFISREQISRIAFPRIINQFLSEHPF